MSAFAPEQGWRAEGLSVDHVGHVGQGCRIEDDLRPILSTNSIATPLVLPELELRFGHYTGSQTVRVHAALRDAILTGELV